MNPAKSRKTLATTGFPKPYPTKTEKRSDRGSKPGRAQPWHLLAEQSPGWIQLVVLLPHPLDYTINHDHHHQDGCDYNGPYQA